MKVKEIREMRNDTIISLIYYMGIQMSGGKQKKKDDIELKRYCDELYRRGIIDSSENLYLMMCK